MHSLDVVGMTMSINPSESKQQTESHDHTDSYWTHHPHIHRIHRAVTHDAAVSKGMLVVGGRRCGGF
jgi:hypothetical protein